MQGSADSFTLTFEPVGKRATFRRPLTVLEAAQEANIPLLALCGGLGFCGRCRVRVQGPDLPPPSRGEQEIFSPEELAEGYRLACRTVVQTDAVIYVPPSSQPAEAQRLQVSGREEPVECCPLVEQYSLSLSQPTLDDVRSDLQRVADALQARHGVALRRADAAVLPALSRALRGGGWRVVVSVREGELVHVTPAAEAPGPYGVAVDLGSTKIAVYLVSLETGQIVAAHGVPNPQVAYGEDIISRIHYACTQPGGADRLRAAVVEAVNQAIQALCSAHALSPEAIVECTLVGNTAMHHLFLGLPAEQLARSPFVPVATQPLDLKAREAGLQTAPGAYVHLPPAIAGFVGSDHVAMLLATRLPQREGTWLGIDIGTNTEVSLKRGGEIWSVSCASGPAFEGAALTCGMKAAPGAVERVWYDPEAGGLRYTTIGGRPPTGICGSGILDCVAAMRQAGLLDVRGRIQQGRGVRKGRDGLWELVLAEGREGPDVVVTQRDVERIQLAKGAIRSGIEVLFHAAGIGPAEVDGVLLAGAFGSYIDPLSALRVGMFPPIPLDRFAQVGNAAGIGAKEVLVSTARREEAKALANQVHYLELTVYPGYSGFFARSLRL